MTWRKPASWKGCSAFPIPRRLVTIWVFNYRFRRNIPRFFESFRFSRDRFDEFEEGFDRIHQIGFGGRYAITSQWALTYRGDYSFEENLYLSNAAGVEFISRCRCWAVRLEARDERTQGVVVELQYTLIGLGDESAVRPFSGGQIRSIGLRRIGGEQND